MTASFKPGTIAAQPGLTTPVVFAIFLIELALITGGIARSFGRGAGTIVGLTVIFPVFCCILGFGSAMYRGAATWPD